MQENIMELLEKKFNSGNDIPVTRAAITREEYEMLLDYIEYLNNLYDCA